MDALECYTLVLEFLVYQIQLVTSTDKELIWMLGGQGLVVRLFNHVKPPWQGLNIQ